MLPQERDKPQSKDNEWLSSTAAAVITIYDIYNSINIYAQIQAKSINWKRLGKQV